MKHLVDKTKTDFQIRNEGTLVLLWLDSTEARRPVRHHLPEDASRFGTAFAIEPRYIHPIVAGIFEDGLIAARA